MQEKAQGCIPLNLQRAQEVRGLSVAWLGGAGIFLMHNGTCALIDPCLYADENGVTELGHTAFYEMPLRPQDVPGNAAVLYTHADYDHMGLKTALLLPETVEFYAPARCIRALKEAGIAEDRLHLVRPNESFTLGNMVIAAIAADHSWQVLDPSYGEPFGPEDCVGYDVTTPEAKLLFPGDTRLCPHHTALPDVYDLLALDVSDDPYHLGHENMALLAGHFSRAKLLPNHFGTYDAPEAVPHNGSLTALKALLGDHAARVLPDVIGNCVVFESRTGS